MRTVVTAGCVLIVGATGCAPDRCLLGNGDLAMIVRATDLFRDGAEEVRVGVEFSTGDASQVPTPWSTCEGDRILINGEEARETEQDDRIEYTRTLTGDSVETITVELDRADRDLVTATVDRPLRFDVVSPQPGELIPRSEAAELTWSPPADGGELQIEVQEELGGGRCIVSDDPDHDYKGVGGVRVQDTGAWTIPAGVLANEGDLRCDARYVLSRFSRGEYPEALAPGGFIEARVVRVVVFESVP